MLSAIILCRSDSSRLKNKHFCKIGKKYLIEVIIDKLLSNKYVNEVYIASGPYKKNFKFLELKKIYQSRVKIYFHKNENNLIERIYFLSKKIINPNTLIISGDCPIIDSNFIEIIYKNFLKFKDFDYVRSSKNVFYEGIMLLKKVTWKKIYKISKKDNYGEYFSRILNDKKKLKIKKITVPKSILKTNKDNIRLSIDTVSDLNFFNLIFQKVKSYEKLNLKNILKYKKYSIVNSHVLQKKYNITYKKKVVILTLANNKFGIGHFKRCLVLKRQIEETFSTNINFEYLNSEDVNPNFISKYRFKKFRFTRKDKNVLLIIDLPQEKIKFLKKKLNVKIFSKIINIDSNLNLQKVINIYPQVKKRISKNNSLNLIGKDYLILDHNLIQYKFKKKKRYKRPLILSGGSSVPSIFFLNHLIDKKIKPLVVLGPLVDKNKITYLKKFTNKFKIIFSPKNYFDYIFNSENVICRYGVSVFECIALGVKPHVIINDETSERLKDIFLLEKMGYINVFREHKKLICKHYAFNYKNFPIGAKFITNFLNDD